MMRFETSTDAEDAFYRAFEEGTVAAMEQVWAEEEEVVCVHPMGEPLLGRVAVLHGWRRVFSTAQRLRFHIVRLAVHTDGTLAVHWVEEHIHHGADLAQTALVVATNVYRYSEEVGWKLSAHHGSPAAMVGGGDSGERPLH